MNTCVPSYFKSSFDRAVFDIARHGPTPILMGTHQFNGQTYLNQYPFSLVCEVFRQLYDHIKHIGPRDFGLWAGTLEYFCKTRLYTYGETVDDLVEEFRVFCDQKKEG